jgi:hypothetical protein
MSSTIQANSAMTSGQVALVLSIQVTIEVAKFSPPHPPRRLTFVLGLQIWIRLNIPPAGT